MGVSLVVHPNRHSESCTPCGCLRSLFPAPAAAADAFATPPWPDQTDVTTLIMISPQFPDKDRPARRRRPPRNAGLQARMRTGRPRSQAAGSRCHAAMQSPKKTLHGAPCNALQRFLNSLSNLEIFGAEVGCSAQNAPNAAVIVGRPRKNRPEMSVLSHLTGQKWPKPDRLLSGDWGMFAGAACCSRHCAHQSG